MLGKFLARPEGLEPPAYWFEASRSIQLSYGRVEPIVSFIQRTANALGAIKKYSAHSECVVRDKKVFSAQRMRCAR
jgi:hypothetical protein